MLDIMPQIIVCGILIGGVYALLSVGLTLIFGVLRIVNFAQGEFVMLAMFGSFWLHHLFKIDPYLSILIVVPIIFGLGILCEILVINVIFFIIPCCSGFCNIRCICDTPKSGSYTLGP